MGTAINVVLTVCAAFALSKKTLPGRNLFTFLFTFTMLFSGGIIPTYLHRRLLGREVLRLHPAAAVQGHYRRHLAVLRGRPLERLL